MLARMREFVTGVHEGRITGHRGARYTDVVNIGIGGSDLGIVMAAEALARYRNRAIRLHCVSNVDGAELSDLLEEVRPGQHAVRGLLQDVHDAGDADQRADGARLAGRRARRGCGPPPVRRGVDQRHRDGRVRDRTEAPLHDVGLGGRPLLALVGRGAVDRACARHGPVRGAARRRVRDGRALPLRAACVEPAGAHGTDRRLEHELPRRRPRTWSCRTTRRLHRFPAYLQQLEMESNGKGVTRTGAAVDYPTGTIVWGEPGNNAQHSFFQLLHQGTARFSMDLLAPVNASSPLQRQHDLALANCFAQAEAFAFGQTESQVLADLQASGIARGSRDRPRAAQGASGQPAVQPDPVSASRTAESRAAARLVRAQGVRAERDLGRQSLRPVGRRARQEARRADGARRVQRRLAQRSDARSRRSCATSGGGAGIDAADRHRRDVWAIVLVAAAAAALGGAPGDRGGALAAAG